MIIEAYSNGSKAVILERIEMALFLMALRNMAPQSALNEVDELIEKGVQVVHEQPR